MQRAPGRRQLLGVRPGRHRHGEPSRTARTARRAWHCSDARKAKGTAMGGGISVDQVIANQIGGADALPVAQDSGCRRWTRTPTARLARTRAACRGRAPEDAALQDRQPAGGLRSAGDGGRSDGAGSRRMPAAPDPKLAQTRALQKSAARLRCSTARALCAQAQRQRQGPHRSVPHLGARPREAASPPGMQISGGGAHRRLRRSRAPDPSRTPTCNVPRRLQPRHARQL